MIKVKKIAIIAPVLFILFSGILFLNMDKITLSPWVDIESIGFVTYETGNDGRIAIINNSEKTITVLDVEDEKNELVYKLEAKPHKRDIFSSVKFVELDEQNNLYVLDVDFGGAFDENVERVLKYSPDGVFMDEIFTYRYANVDFLTTKGKISGMAYFDSMIYLIRFENDGFWLERAPSIDKGEVEVVKFFDYPNALRDLVYVHINALNKIITVTTKSGAIKQYGFNGALTFIHQADTEVQSVPWTAISDNMNNIVYADIISGEIVMIDSNSGESRVLYTASGEETPYYRINYTQGMIFASAYDEATSAAYAREDKYLQEDEPEFIKINTYSYSSTGKYIRITLFVLLILDAIALLLSAVMLIMVLLKLKIRGSLKTILFAGFCITFGAIMSAVLIINEMDNRYNQKAYNELENVSRLIAASVDINILTSLTSPSQFDEAEYLQLKDTIKNLFTQLRFRGELLYQILLIEKDGIVYVMSDLESSTGIFFPMAEYEDSYFQEAVESGEYVHFSNVTSEGRWLFTCGPILNNEGETIALIETGYDMRTVQEQTRAMIFQTILIVIATAIAILLIVIEFILILEAYNKNKTEVAKNESLSSHPKSELRKAMISFMIMMTEAVKVNKIKEKKELSPAFHPELLRAIIFFLFISSNLATALLPMYSSNLYQPLFNIPREFIVTLPFMTDMIFAAIALLLIPVLLEKIGIKKIGIIAGILIVVGNLLCFLANNTLYLAVAYACTGFAGGALLLVINTIIGAQKQIDDVNSGFAHFNASYLAGVNVGVVFGSIFAQFFSYRIVYLFSTLTAVILLGMLIFSVRSKLVNHIYNIGYFKERRKNTLIKFIGNPIVLCTLFLVLLPYVVSMSFINYFMPVFGTDNGLRESNIGQLLLLNGLFAVLFGTALCGYVSKKFSLKIIMIVSLLLNIGAIYLFTINVSIIMLIIVVVLLAIANIFTLTNIQTYYATLYQNSRVSSMKALSVYSAVENMSMAIGPLVFSYILAYNIVAGMRLLAAVLLICLILFIIISALVKDKKGKK